ncbi:alanine racemase [Corynebacterium hansenii]|uniref:Alanine racemase n=1 Tax=Corynebacterium hansenii TaxID=394964 RepID=A0ABV7ZPG4_9CORY|nr:alanine racemase [Corynebacterium hansenii]WJZ00261.1 D-threonine aldolase [Corynebacterium hansenii]
MNAPALPVSEPVPRSIRDAVADERLPALVVDLDAVDANADDLLRRAGGTPIRVASKSLRIPELISHVLAKPGFQGVLAYTLAEALMLFSEGISDDILVAYPTADDAALAELAADAGARAAIAIMVDSAEQLPALARHASEDAPLRICLDIDASWAPAPGVHIGTLRSPTHSPRQAADLARAVDSTPGLRVVGVMMYEGHIAGVGDAGAGPRATAIRIMQKLSRRELAKRRARVVAAVERAVGPLELVNGGGTGSLESTCAERAVTEAAAGSGFVAPTLFDGYRAFTLRPASWFVLPVVRRPKKDTVTVAGGGRIASGPAGGDRLPSPVHPAGLTYAADEGPGEVQTPLTGDAAHTLRIGDAVWFRHAKAGETAEHANEAVVVSGGDIVGRWATYRGKGLIYS